MVAVDVIIWLIAVLTLIPATTLLFQVMLALPIRSQQISSTSFRPDVAVLIPAHNESAVIAKTLLSVKSQLRSNDRMLVVADNCDDETASIAAAFGVEVRERFDNEKRGKGFALDFGMQFLKYSSPIPSIVIIVDADCELNDGALDELAKCCYALRRPVQAHYEMELATENRGSTSVLSALAWRLKNLVRPLGNSRWDLPCLLQGTGMAFPWQLISDAPLANGHLVEDLKLTLDLAIDGHFTAFCPQAKVKSYFPSNPKTAATQRSRWEHGFLGAIVAYGPRLLLESISQKSLRLFTLFLELSIPPLSFLLMSSILSAGLCAVYFLATSSFSPLAISIATLVMLTSAVLLAWSRFARDLVNFRDLVAIPVYVIAKVPIYGRLLLKREKNWIKTSRD